MANVAGQVDVMSQGHRKAIHDTHDDICAIGASGSFSITLGFYKRAFLS